MLPVSLPVFRSEFKLLAVGSSCTFALGPWFFALSFSFLQLCVVGLGEFPLSVFSLGWTRVSANSLSFLWLVNPLSGPLPWTWIVSPFVGRLSEVDNRAVDSSLVLLSSHLNLSSPAFISGALVCSPLLPRNLVFVVLASCLDCVLLLTKTLLRLCSLFEGGVYCPFSFFSGLFCFVFLPDSVALLCLFFWEVPIGVFIYHPWPSLWVDVSWGLGLGLSLYS